MGNAFNQPVAALSPEHLPRPFGSLLHFPWSSLLTQTYGGKNLKQVGTILQRGILILLLCCFPCWALFINTERILLLIQQDPEVSRSGVRSSPSGSGIWLCSVEIKALWSLSATLLGLALALLYH